MASINFDFTTGVLPGAITFTRASIGTYNSSGNILTTASSNVARFNYVGGVANLLIEPAATNMLLQSNAFGTAPWAPGNSSIRAANQFISPDGTNNGWTIDSGNSGIDGYYQGPTYTNAPYTMSAWVKQAASVGCTFQMANINTDLATSPVLTRLSGTKTVPAGLGNAIYIVNTFTAHVVLGIYGAQVELGSVMTSYIPTTTTAVTRAADSAAFTIPAGVTALQFTFDDGSKQVVSVTPGPYTIPTNLNRANIKSIQSAFVLDFTSGSLPAGVTLTRPSIGTYTSNAGLLTTAGNDVARFNYVGGVSNLLIEGSATNLLLQSNNFSNAAWTAGSGAVLTAAQFISPDGSNNGWSLTSGTGNGYLAQVIAFSAIPYTTSVWAKSIVGSAPVSLYVFGTTVSPKPTTTTLARIFEPATPPAGSDNCAILISAASGSTDGFYGAQLETGSKPTSYIPTTTAPATRAADAATFTVPSGINLLTYTFDDNSTQAVPVSPGSYTVPVTLNRANIKSIVGTTVPPPNFDFTTGALPAGITFTRGSIGTYFNNAGVLITAGNDVARFNYIAGVSNLLIEPAATNLLPQSNAFSNVAWSVVNGATLAGAQFVSVDGANNGWSVTNGAPGIGGFQVAFTFSNVPYTASIWAKQITGTSPIAVNLSSSISSSMPTTGVLTRLATTMTPPAGASTVVFYINDFTSGKVDGFYGAQLETGTAMSSYIPTGATAVTRAADSAVFSIPAGTGQLLYTFDDGSTFVVAVSPGSYTIPTNLPRPNIRSIVGSAAPTAGINFNFTTGVLPSGMGFARPSIGTYTNNAGIMITAGSGVPRFNYIGGVANLLIEPSATNMLTQSNNFAAADWLAQQGPVMTAAQFVSPDGTNDGWTITTGTGTPFFYQTSPVFTNAPYTISVWAKRITGTADLQLYIAALSAPAALTTTLVRVSYTTTPPAGQNNGIIQLNGAAGMTDGFYGAQLEAGSVPTSYIPTTTTTVTRAADSASFVIPPGIGELLYTFDDDSMQAVIVSPGSYIIPTNLARRNIKTIVGVTSLFDFTTGILPAGITFTRASIGTYTNATGTLITAGNDVARFNYVSGVANLLIEGSATNLLVQSNGFGSSPWVQYSGGVLTAAQFVSPDGTNNGWSLNNPAGFGGRYNTPINFSVVPYTFSIWSKFISGTDSILFKLISGATPSAGTAAALTRGFAVMTPASAGPDTAYIQMSPSATNGTDGIYGAQLETGSKMTSYIPTTTAAVTRAADSATFTVPAGVNQLVYLFDDNSTQTVAVSPGSYTIPTNLARPNIRCIMARFGYDLTTGSLPAGFTFTRASTGTYITNTGALATAGVNVARFNYAGGTLCLLIEPTATNLFLQSNTFSDAAYWIKVYNPTITAAQFVSPDGTNDGWSMTGDSPGLAGVAQYVTGGFSNIPYALSIWAKLIIGTAQMLLEIHGISYLIAVSTTLTRISSIIISPPAGSYGAIYVYGNASVSNGIFGVQVEVGSVATSYIPTTTIAAAATRAADFCTLTIPAGMNRLIYTFDDNSTQAVAVSPGSYTIPNNLARLNIKNIVGAQAFSGGGTVVVLQCAKCGFYMKTTNPHDANIIAAKHTAGWGPAHIVSVT